MINTTVGCISLHDYTDEVTVQQVKPSEKGKNVQIDSTPSHLSEREVITIEDDWLQPIEGDFDQGLVQLQPEIYKDVTSGVIIEIDIAGEGRPYQASITGKQAGLGWASSTPVKEKCILDPPIAPDAERAENTLKW